MAGANLEEIRHDHSVVAGAGRRFGQSLEVSMRAARLRTHLSRSRWSNTTAVLFNGALILKVQRGPGFLAFFGQR